MTGRKAPIFGPEPWAEIAGATWSHWDRWCCAVCVALFAGDWTALADRLEGRFGGVHIGSDAAAKLSHLDDLVVRLDIAGLSASDLAGEVDKATLAKARRKVLEQGLSSRDLTPAMRETPERRLRERALRGSWPAFPVAPSDAAERLAGLVDDAGHVGKRGTFELAEALEGEIAAVVAEAGTDDARLLAARRAVLTAVQEVARRADDSFGVIGEIGQAAWRAYVGTPWRELVAASIYWRDVAELVAFDDHGHLHEEETLPWRRARKADLPLIVRALGDLADELDRARLRYHAGQARVAVAHAHVAARHLAAYPEVAHVLGSEHWMPVVALAESALRAGRADLAAAVFDAADQPGAHREHLRRRRTELLGAPPGSALRVIDGGG